MTFNELNISEEILHALKSEGYTTPTPIQEQAIPSILEGKDLLGCAKTGTGKTAAFAIPTLQRLNENPSHRGQRNIRALILTPTRELAIQIDDSFSAYGRNIIMKHTVIFGGVSQVSQVNEIRRGTEILIATPGRLLDLIQQRVVNLQHVEIFILDEADRMLDMGFINDVKRVIALLPKQRQNLFFSATMPKEIQSLADTILYKPVKVEVTPVSSTAEKIDQAIFMVEKPDKRALLHHILNDKSIRRVLVFTRTKHGADKVVRDLDKAGIKSEAIHGNKAQNARQRALTNFKDGRIRVLVATDIAARGIDVDEITHVINYEIPNEPETYVHRIGRTARAGASGIAFSFCDEEERSYMKDIEKLTKQKIPVIKDQPYNSPVPVGFDLPKEVKQIFSSADKNNNRRKSFNGRNRGPNRGNSNRIQNGGRAENSQRQPQTRTANN
jgi:ATP-dependent RNA helicase RhlE